MNHNYRELEIWKDGIELTKMVYQLTKDFPKEEIYGLTDQIRRSAISIPANIAEGCGRDTDKDFNYFLAIAKGSSYELETHLILAKELGYISEENLSPILNKLHILQRKIFRFFIVLCQVSCPVSYFLLPISYFHLSK